MTREILIVEADYMIYYAEESSDGYAVIGRGNDRAADVGLTENQADRRAHELAGEGGYVGS